MKAVLVGGVGSDRLYYLIDSDDQDKDGILEKANGQTINLNFMDFVSSCRGLRKIRTSRFHRSLWDAPVNPTRGSWYETFITKTKPINEKTLDGAVVVSSLGSGKRKSKSISSSIEHHLHIKGMQDAATNGCCSEVVKFGIKDYVFKTETERKQAWDAVVLMRKIEGVSND